MVPTEKLGAACFSENVNLFGDPRTQPEKYNLYRGLTALSETVESLVHHVHRLEMELTEANRKLDNLLR